MTYRDTMKRQICSFVNEKASDTQLIDMLSFTLDLQGAVEPETEGNGRKRIPKKPRRGMTRGEADQIREQLCDLKRGSVEYNKVRDRLCRELGFTRRQVGAAACGLEAAQTKRKKGKTE